MENEDIIGIKIKRFISYLNKIGLLPEGDNKIFLNNFYELAKSYNNIEENININLEINQKYIEEILKKTLITFFNSLNEEKNKIITLNIYKKYISEEKSSRNEKALKLYKIYLKLKTGIFFKKWFVISKRENSKTIFRDILGESNINTISYNISTIPNDQAKYLAYTNNSYNSFYNFSPTNKTLTMAKHIPLNLKHMNLTRNHEYSLNAINLGDRLLQSKSNNNKTESKIDYKKSYTFTNDFSPYDNNNKYIYEEKDDNNLFSGQIYQLFNKKINLNKKSKNKINSKLKAHLAYLGNLSKSKKEHKLIPEKTTEYLKEQEEIKNNCTFKPKINNYKTPKSTIKKIKYNNMLTSEKLYLDNQKIMAKRAVATQIRDNKISKENTFQPKFMSTSVKKLKKNFNLRLNNFSKLKEVKINKLINSIESNYNSICTFSPKLNLSYNSKIDKNNNNLKKIKIPAYQRLYNDNKEKLIRQEERKNQAMEEILIKANNINIGNLLKNVDYEKLNDLYKDYKKNQIKIKKKREIIDNEEGITFNPILINGEKYLNKIEPNFFKREKNFVENQRNNIEAYRNYLNQEKEKYLKRYSEDKKTIVQNVVERLYKEGLDKVLTKNKTKPNIFANSKNYYKTENKDDYDGNETIYVSQSVLKVESLKESTKMKKSSSNESNLAKSNIKTATVTNDNLSLSKDNNNYIYKSPLILNSNKK